MRIFIFKYVHQITNKLFLLPNKTLRYKSQSFRTKLICWNDDNNNKVENQDRSTEFWVHVFKLQLNNLAEYRNEILLVECSSTGSVGSQWSTKNPWANRMKMIKNCVFKLVNEHFKTLAFTSLVKLALFLTFFYL